MNTSEKSTLATSARGVVYVEFLLCFIPVFMLFLGVVQLALISGAKLVVKHAAYRGARSASVVLADDPKFYDDEEIGFLGQEENKNESEGSDGSSNGSAANESKTTKLADTVTDTLDKDFDLDIKAGLQLAKSAPSGQRNADVRRAVYMPLCAITPGWDAIKEMLGGEESAPSLAAGISDDRASRIAAGLLIYNDASTAVRFPVDESADRFYQERVDTSDPDITVRVIHLFRCTIPLIAPIVCRSGRDLGGNYIKARVTNDDDHADAKLFEDLDYVPFRAGLGALLASRSRFYVLREQATVAAQWAPYTYWRPEE